MFEFEKRNAERTNICSLYTGRVILYNGKQYIFHKIADNMRSIQVRNIKSKKLERISISENITEEYFDVIGYCEEAAKNPKNDIYDLKNGDLFVLNNGKISSFIFRFERTTRTNIVATDPMNNKEIRIPMDFGTTCTKIENLPY